MSVILGSELISNQSSSLFECELFKLYATTAQWVKDEPFRIGQVILAEIVLSDLKMTWTEIGELKQLFPSFGDNLKKNELRSPKGLLIGYTIRTGYSDKGSWTFLIGIIILFIQS